LRAVFGLGQWRVCGRLHSHGISLPRRDLNLERAMRPAYCGVRKPVLAYSRCTVERIGG
jgi:hypothetical protein